MNWGYKLMIVFIVFATMMSYMVYRCFGTNFELVEKEYYKSELVYQDVIDGANNANALSSAPVISQSGQNIILQMPEEMKNTTITGSVLFYCAYNSLNDKKITLNVNKSGTQSFAGKITPGKYTMKINWNNNGKKYYTEKKIIII